MDLKLKIYKNPIRTVVTDTWIMLATEENALSEFQR